MPNWCYTYYRLTGDKKEINKLHRKLITLTEDKDDKWKNYLGNGYGSMWLGCLLGIHGYDAEKDPEELRFRGDVCGFELVADNTLTFDTSTAWAPMHEALRWILKKHYPSINVYYESEEEGMSEFSTNAEGTHYYLFTSINDDMQSQYMLTEDELVNEIIRIYPDAKVSTIAQVFDYVNKVANDNAYDTVFIQQYYYEDFW